MVVLYQDAVLPCNLPLKEAFCSSCLWYTCLVWFFLKRQKLLTTYGPAILIPYFFVEACDCLKAECVFGTDVDYKLILFLLALGMNVNSHLQSKTPLKFGTLFWLYPLETNF